ncbi:unnamed protein product [Blepharisma stoltei]|uniref:Uncharacterized protein n=1 Tax=Blepharisma stoltei TaxID=1481888 RepID=A0AAU9JA01_9CILI|nr:unnamed protein product [Blepharisma stoltei]
MANKNYSPVKVPHNPFKIQFQTFAGLKHFIKHEKSSSHEIYLAQKLLNDAKNWITVLSVKNSYFNVINFADHWNITRHLQKFASKDHLQLFYKIILLSRDSEEISQASSNAATILNKLGFIFDNKDFSNIKIPYADLSKNSFLKANFSNSDLTFADFTSSVVAHCDFSNCKMRDSKLSKLIFDGNSVWKLAISKCEKYVAVVNEKDDSIFLISTDLEKIICTVEISNYFWKDIKDLKFSLDSSSLYILYKNSAKLAIWNFAGDSKVIEFEDKDALDSIISDTMLAYIMPNFIMIKEIATFKTLYQIDFGENPQNCSLVNLSQKFLVWRKLRRKNIEIWYFESGEKYKKYSNNHGFQNDIYFDHWGNYLELWKIKGDEPIWKIKYDTVKMYFNSSNKFIEEVNYKKLWIIDIEKQKFLKTSKSEKIWEIYNDIKLYGLCNYDYFGLKCASKTLKSYYFTEEPNLKTNNFYISSMIFSENIILNFLSGFTKIFDIETRKLIKSTKLPINVKSNYLASSGDLYAFGNDDFIEIWNIKYQKLVTSIKIGYQFYELQISWEYNQFSLYSCQDDSYLIYSIDSGAIIKSINNIGFCEICKFTGDYLIYYVPPDSVRIWRQNSIKIEHIFLGAEIGSITCSPCKKWAALHNSRNKSIILILNIDTKLFSSVSHESSEIYEPCESCFSPCGQYFITARCSDIILWDTTNCAKIAKMNVSFSGIWKISFSECGRYIASTLYNLIILIWDAEECIKNHQKRIGTDSDTILDIDRVIVSDKTVFVENNLSGVVYVGKL